MAGAVAEELAGGVRLGYRPELDGLRAVAVVAVIGTHYWNEATGPLPGGFLGVDLFFVLSGFLITRLLLEERVSTHTIRLGAFYRRRVLRLYPALLILLGFIAIVSVTINPWHLTRNVAGQDILTTGLYVSNWWWMLGHFLGPLAHTWSLSVEEQFYLLWPLTMLFACRRLGLRGVRIVSLSLVALGTLDSLVRSLSGTSSSKLYLGTDTHGMVVIMAGCFLATVMPVGAALPRTSLGHQSRRLLVPAVVILAAMVALTSPTSVWLWRGGFLAVAVLMLILVCGVEQSRSAQRMLAVPLIVWIGRISYGLYLWHYPLRFMVDDVMKSTGATAFQLRFFALVATFAAAAASYSIVELPIRRRWSHPLPRIDAASASRPTT